MTKAQMQAAILRIQSEQNAIALEYGFAELITYTAKHYDNKPREPAQTGDNPTLTATAKRDIFYVIGGKISRIVKSAKKRTEGKTMKKLYIESDNGGRYVMLRIEKKWYVCDCAPSGYFGTVDIFDGTEEETAARMRKAIDEGEIYDENDCAENLETFRYIPDYDGLTAKQIENRENDGRTCDYMRMVEI